MVYFGSRNDRAIVYVSFPHQLLHALSALQYDRQLRGMRVNSPATIFVWSYRAANHAYGSAYGKLLAAAISQFPHVTLALPTLMQRCVRLLPYQRVSARARWISCEFADDHIEAVYFSHDASADRTAQAVMQAFPGARRVCYGDPPGFLGPSYSENIRDRKADRWLKRRFWESRVRDLEALYVQTASIIAIDFRSSDADAAGGAVDHVKVLPRTILTENLLRIQAGLRETLGVDDVMACIKTNKEIPPYLLLLSNFSESGLMTSDNEMKMYVDICGNYVAAGARILIKPHFGTRADFVSRLVARLVRFRARLLPESLQLLPVELMSEVVSACQVISVSSSSALLVKLLGVDVIHALSADLIQRYFKASAVDYMVEANECIKSKMIGGGGDAIRIHTNF